MKKQRLLVVVFASLALAGWSGDAEIIVESFTDGYNSQGFSQVTGKWSPSSTKSTAEGVKASKTLYNDANEEAATARFTPDIPVAGKYEVFMTYPVQGNAKDVKYKVTSADGEKEVSLTQNGRDLGNNPAANKWYSLGVFTFNAGNAGFVEVSDPQTGERPLANEPNARIYVDAVKFVPQGMSLPADYVNKTNGESAPAEPQSAAQASLPAVTAPAAGLPELPSSGSTVVASAVTPASGAAAALPGLPGSTDAAAPASALPSLPNATPRASAALPSLPATSSAAPGLPALPASTPDAAPGLPALPAATAGAAANLPSLPAAPAAAPGLPDLPSAQAPAATPIPTPDLPSLAPVTPTPQRTAPSPADTPIGAPPAGLPGGTLNNLPPMPGPGMPDLPTGPAPAPAPVPFTPASTLPAVPLPGAAAPSTPVTAVASPAPVASQSITQYNPSNLQWVYDFGAALNMARAQNKKVMVFFTATGNQAAQTYETQYFQDPSVRQALNNFVLVKVDFPKNTRLGYSLGIFGAGIIVVTDGTGNVTSRIEQLPATPMDLIRQMAQAKLPPPVSSADAAVPGTAAPVTSGTIVTEGTSETAPVAPPQ